MAYKYFRGTHKLGLDATIDTTVGDIELGAAQVDAADMSVPDNMLQFSRLEMTLGANADADGQDVGIFKFSVNSKFFRIQLIDGAGTDDVGFPTAVSGGGSAGANDANAYLCRIYHTDTPRTNTQLRNAIVAAIGADGTAGGGNSFNTRVGGSKTFICQNGPSGNVVEILGQELNANSNFANQSETGFGDAGIVIAKTDYASQKSFFVATDRGVVNTNVTDMKNALALTKANVGLGSVDNVSQSTIQSNTLAAATSADVGLGNVTNESKTTMFTAPSLTGNVGIGSARLSESADALTVATLASNANITLSPNGTGAVLLPANYTSALDDAIMPKSYIDGVAQGLDIKASVLASSVSGVSAGQDLNGLAYTASNTADVPDELDLGNASGQNCVGFFDGEKITAVGQRILIKDFVSGNRHKNGIYQVKTLPVIVRSSMTITKTGVAGDATAGNDEADIDFIVAQKLFRIRHLNDASAASAGFATGTGAGSSKVIDYTDKPSDGQSLKFRFDHDGNGSPTQYQINFADSGAEHADFSGGNTRTVRRDSGSGDDVWAKVATLIGSLSNLSCTQSPHPSSDDADSGRITIESEIFANLEAGDTNNTVPDNSSLTSTTNASPFIATVGKSNTADNVGQLIDNTESLLTHGSNGLNQKTGKTFTVSQPTAVTLKITESAAESNALESVDFKFSAHAGTSLSGKDVALSGDAFAVSTRGELKRSFLKAQDGGLANGNEPLTPGSFTFIEKGASLADTGWVMSSDSALTSNNAVNIEFTQFSSAGIQSLSGISLGSITAGQVSASEAIVVDSNRDLVHASNHVRHMNVMSLREEVQVIDTDGAGSTLAIDSGAIVIIKFGTTGTRVKQDYTLTIPEDLPAGCVIKIKRNDDETNSHDLTIQRTGSDKIDGENSIKLDSDFAGLSLISDGSDYFII